MGYAGAAQCMGLYFAGFLQNGLQLHRVSLTIVEKVGSYVLAFGIGILIDIAIKLRSGVPPYSTIMLLFAGVALVANLACLQLLWRFRRHDVNMASTFECSRNDVISNVGVLVAACFVAAFHSPWPDIIVGTIIAATFLRSAFGVIRSALPVLRVSGASA